MLCRVCPTKQMQINRDACTHRHTAKHTLREINGWGSGQAVAW